MSDVEYETSHDRPVRRRRAPKGEKRREALLDAATAVFAEHGYEAASMRRVAERVGITPVGLLHHFPNKTALLEALLARRDRRVTEKFAALEMAPTLDGFVAFAVMSLRFSVESRQECQAAMRINVESLSSEHPAHVWQQEKFALTHDHARGHLRQLIEVGEVRSDVDVDAVVTEMFAVMDGLQIQWLRSQGEVDAVAVFDGYLRRLAEAIRREGAGA
ncbi:TetR/AcrR family transcriptional regulator [Halomonas elongata]|uniref:Helix-turn-helix domain-containing protein n=1 Tax=Halomonas elongata (strain ATCC 33173 / DSM 2581 / NBRC 15536 / NCIMB 2198 / 1H9) TaxID=768066 RepID=A0ABZ0TFZ2_HALED|nr:TetR/AcrR family transcriptional regulator [Halomonas elongata]WBF16394.1 TetR/AcrR family transcriptional regulator [Halomonas elongata]WPU48834.1 helix-turn-helix domain-containing protein [Halomonas elongata DSM 2581]